MLLHAQLAFFLYLVMVVGCFQLVPLTSVDMF